MHLVIIGGVAAGSKAAARARRVNPTIDITLFQDETEVSYTACGQPYYLSGLIKHRNALIIRRPKEFAVDNIVVKVLHRVTELNLTDGSLQVLDLRSDKVHQIDFDRLILATGARSVIPDIPDRDLQGVLTLRSIAELDQFKQVLEKFRPRHAVIAGSGYIGLEMLESLSELNIQVTLLSRNQQVFSHLDPEMSDLVKVYLDEKNIQIILGDGIAGLVGRNGRVREVTTCSGTTIPADMVVLALGVEPNTELAMQSGIKLGSTGAIAVDSSMQTNIAGVYAAGDCVESRHRVSGLPVWQPLGDTANLQGRIAGENAAGGHARFPGVMGTAICKTFDLNIGLTGLTEEAAKNAGFNTISIVTNVRDKARYYPGVKQFTLKLVAEAQTGRLLGAQAVGQGTLDKTIDIAATALLGNLTCADLENADLAYAPPFSPVLSPIIVAAGALGKLIHPTD